LIRRAFASLPLLVVVALAVLAVGACGGDPAESEAHRVLRERIDPAAYHLGLAMPDAATFEAESGRRVGSITAVAYEPGHAISVEVHAEDGSLLATLEAAYVEGVEEPLVPGGRIHLEGLDDALQTAAIASARRLHDAGYEVPPLPDNLDAGSWVVGLFQERLQQWLAAALAGDDDGAASAEVTVQGECHAARTFETARWAFLAAPCFEVWRASALEREGDRAQAVEALERAAANVEATLAAFRAATR
jgi:hypothetical protein